MSQEDYIKEKQAEFAMNIDEFNIGDIMLGNDGFEARITGKTSNSIEVFHKGRTKKDKKTGAEIRGHDCYHWYDMPRFNRFFIKKK